MKKLQNILATLSTATLLIGCQTGPPPKQVLVGSTKASFTASSMETRNHSSIFSDQSSTVRVFSDKYGCPSSVFERQHGFVVSANLTSEKWKSTFDIPVGNYLFIYFRETYENQMLREWCAGAFVFKPKEGAHYNFRINSNISDMFVEQSCSFTLHVKHEGREEIAARFIPIKLVGGGLRFDQTICRR